MNNVFKDKLFASLLITLLLGFIIGIIFYFFITSDDKLILINGINEYFSLIKDNSLDKSNSLINIIFNNFLLTNIVYISSILVIFIPFIYFINFYILFNIGFMFSFLISSFKIKGILVFIVSVFPHQLLLILFFLLISYMGLKTSLKVINLIKYNKSINLKVFYRKVIIIYILSILFLIIISILEVYLNSYLLRCIL